MKKSKVRFGVSADWKPREIFSVREGGDKGLTIVRRTPRSLREGGTDFTFKEQHLSIHNSERSVPKGTTITQKSRYHGRTRSRAAFVENTSDYLFSPVYSATTGYMLPGTNLLTPRVKDIAVVFPHGFTQNATTIIYSVYVTLKGFRIPVLRQTSGVYRDFALYRLYVLYNFIPLPTPEVGISTFYRTSPQITDDVSEGDPLDRAPRTSLRDDEFPSFHFTTVQRLANAVVTSFVEQMKVAGVSPSLAVLNSLMERSRHVAGMPIRLEPIKPE